MKTIISVIFTLITFYVSGQGTYGSVRGQVIDEVSEIPIKAVKVAFEGSDGSTRQYQTDSLGNFIFYVDSNVIYKVAFVAKRYLSIGLEIDPRILRDTTFVVHLPPLEQGSFLPEFVFAKNGLMTLSTESFEVWGINQYRDTSTRILVIGYCSPDEPDSIALLRAKEIINQFVTRGANSRSFVAVARPNDFPDMHHDHKVTINGKDVFLRKESELSHEYIKRVAEIEKEAIYFFMRRVQLEFENW